MKDAIVLCMRVADCPDPVPGSVTERCQGGCGEDVWISKATSESVGTAPAWCSVCVMTKLAREGGG